MKVLIFIDVGADVRVPPLRDPRSGRVREEWLVEEVDPASEAALDLALALTAGRPNGHLTVVHLGSSAHDPFLRRALARGCQAAVRVYDDEAAEAETYGKALVLAAAAQAAGFDLILTGDRGAVAGGGQVGALIADHLGVPCIGRVSEAELSPDSRRLHATRELERGFREKVEAGLPVLLTVAPSPGGGGGGAMVSAQALLEALDRELPVWTLADLGVPAGAVRRADGPLEHGAARPRHPRLHPAAPPDPALPAFDRILGLVRGSVKHREGRIVRRAPEEVAQEVFEVLRDEGWLDHLRPPAS
jgi:electron transfer flavoprotein beta subunit